MDELKVGRRKFMEGGQMKKSYKTAKLFIEKRFMLKLVVVLFGNKWQFFEFLFFEILKV